MVATWSPAAEAEYYTRTGYYIENGAASGTWYAPAGSFGLVDGDPADAATFALLFSGRDPNGESLLDPAARRLDRTGAFDITFSAPKSVSLLGLLGTEAHRAAVLAAHQKAVRAALDLLEREAAWARRGRGGARIERVPLTAACFEHIESRPAEHEDGQIFADPTLHTHAVVLNLAPRPDGSVGALHSTVLRDWKMAAGAAYHAALAAELNAVGFVVDRVGYNGVFEIAGISDEAIRYFSARRNDIAEELAEAGTTSTEAVALAAAVAKSSRRSKQPHDGDLRDTWQAAAREQAFTVAGEQRIGLGADEEALARQLRQLPARLTETQSLFDRRELVRAVAAELVGTGIGPNRLVPAVSHLIDSGAIVEIGTDALCQPRYTTPQMIALEREVVATVSRTLQTPGAALDPQIVAKKCAAAGLSAEQTAAVLAATGGERITIVEGAPGVGKTTLLKPLVAAWREAGYDVVGAATAWKIANALASDLDIEARATASWLKRLDLGLHVLDLRSVLVVDEAGLLSSREMHALVRAVARTGSRLVLVGDRQQLQPIGAGSGLSLVATAVQAANVTAIVRQRDAWMREAVVASGRGQADKALAAFRGHDHLVEADGHAAAIKLAVDHAAPALLSSRPDSALLIARTNAEVAALSREARTRMRAAGLLGPDEIEIDAVTPSGRATQIALARGDRIRFLTREERLGVVNGTTATVLELGPADSGTRHARVTAKIGERLVVFNTGDLAGEDGRVRLSWAYASTIYGCQGLTVQTSTVLLTPAFDRHHLYVATSRSRGATTLIVDRRAIGQLMAEAGPDRNGGEASAAERDAWLARRLAVNHVKQTTLDASIPLERIGERERAIRPELANEL